MKFSESLKKTRDFSVVYQRGRSVANRTLVLYVLRRKGADTNRVGISVSKKVGNSVVRHHLTRLVRESYRLHELEFDRGLDLIVLVYYLHLMVLVYERYYLKMPGLIRALMGKIYRNPKILNKMLLKKDAKNAANAVKNPGSFETQTQIPPEEGYDFSYHNLGCPLSIFAKKYGYEEYMPYLCNLDYVMFGVLGAPLYREHTCFEDGDFCDFKLKNDAIPLPYWPPVFSQDNPYK